MISISQWQARLAELGYYTGKIDDDNGPMTRAATLAYQKWLRDRGFHPGTPDGRVGPMTLAADAEFQAAEKAKCVALPSAAAQDFSLTDAARKLVYKFEIGGGQKYYDAALAMPEWPGYSSGVTIGMGYDLGYILEPQFRRDWGGKLHPRVIDRLSTVIGVTGNAAKPLAAQFRDVTVPFARAQEVFDVTTVPRYWSATKGAFPGVELLPGDAQGALWSLVFNRGASMGGPKLAGYPKSDSRLEMREVRDYVAGGHLSAAANSVEHMARLWKDNLSSDNDLCDRRRAEAKLMRGQG